MTDPTRTKPSGDVADGLVILFFLIAFGLAWSLFVLFIFAADWVVATFGDISSHNPLFILAVYAPAIAALSLVGLKTGFGGMGRFLSRLLIWRTSLAWYGFILVGIPVIFFLGSLVKGNADSAPLFTEPFTSMLPLIGFMMILGPVEELGWRGFALPLLQRKLVPFWAGLVLGIIWAFWHLPAFVLSGTPQNSWAFTPFFLGSVSCSIILTPLFNQARGSILMAMLLHFQLNNPLWPDAQPYDTIFFVAAAVIVVWLNRMTMFSRTGGVTEVVPKAAKAPRMAGS
tara:strand:- start:2239 stop:3093 length:855 start_codon:yes stop_codon:yes gene_type:complete